MDGQRPFTGKPDPERSGQGNRKDSRTHFERYTEIVGQNVGDERSDYADQNYHQPINPRYILFPRELDDQRDDQEHRSQRSGADQSDT